MKRNVKLLAVDPSVVLAVFTGGNRVRFSGIPDSAVLDRVFWDDERNCFVLVVGDASFPEVPLGGLPEFLDVKVFVE